MEQVLNQKDIVVVPFPYTDQTGFKNRPALVLSSDKFNRSSQEVVACAITSNITQDDFTVMIKPEDWKGGVYSESCIKVGVIFTMNRALAAKRIGRLGAERFSEVRKKLDEILGK